MIIQEFPEVVPAFVEHGRVEALDGYFSELRELLGRYLPPEVFRDYYGSANPSTLKQAVRNFALSLPLVRWSVDEGVPGTMSVFLLCPARHCVAIMDFFYEMVEHWSNPGSHMLMVSAKNYLFRFQDVGDERFLAVELVGLVESARDVVNLRRNLPTLVEEIHLGVKAPAHAYQILESKGMSHDEKLTLMQERLLGSIQRHPRLFGGDVLGELQYFRIHGSDEFMSLRDSHHMCRIVSAHYYFRRLIQRALVTHANKRHVKVKLWKTQLKFPFGAKHVLGIGIALNFVKPHELLEAEHIRRAVDQFVPGVKVVPASFFQYRRGVDPVCCFYLEVEKADSTPFTFQEKSLLSQQLPERLQGSVETLVRSVFMKRNEEEVFQNILLLSRELKYVGDIPQVFISYHGQGDDEFVYNIILVRVRKEGMRSLDELFEELPSEVRYFSEQVRVVGTLRKRYPKEANVFTLRIRKERFFRRDHSLDLYRARKYVVHLLNDRVGEVRDYNGGLILKQNELLASVKDLLEEEPEADEFLLENFFYALTPVVMQTVLRPEVVRSLYMLLLQALSGPPCKKGDYQLVEREEGEASLLMILADDSSFSERLYRYFDSLGCAGTELAYSLVESNGVFCLSCAYLVPSEEKRARFCSEVALSIEEWHREKRSTGHLRINLAGGSPVLDPRMGINGMSGVIIKMLYEGLTRMAPGGKPELALAKKVHLSADQCTYTFTLRESVWSNGMNVTAHDFEYAWKKVLDPSLDFRFRFLFYPIRKAKAARRGQASLDEVGVKAVDEKTLKVELEHPTPYFLELVSLWCFAPLCHEVEKVHPGWAHYGDDRYVCNGPFRLSKWGTGQGIEVVKNKSYWQADLVEIQRISIATEKDPEVVYRLFEQDQLDWIGDPICQIPRKRLSQLVQNQVAKSHPAAALVWMQFNAGRFPFNVLKIRKAFGYAVDRKKLIDKACIGDEEPATSVLPPSMQLQKEPYFPDGNRELARKLFEEGIQQVGLDIRDFPTVTVSFPDLEGFRGVAENIAEQCREVLAIPMTVEAYSPEQFLTTVLKKHQYQMGCCLWHSWLNDPTYNLQHLKYRDNGINTSQWEHSEFIRLLDKSDSNLDQEVRRQNLQAAEKVLLDDMPLSPLYSFRRRYLAKERVKGVVVTNTGHVDFRWASVDS